MLVRGICDKCPLYIHTFFARLGIHDARQKRPQERSAMNGETRAQYPTVKESIQAEPRCQLTRSVIFAGGAISFALLLVG